MNQLKSGICYYYIQACLGLVEQNSDESKDKMFKSLGSGKAQVWMKSGMWMFLKNTL